MRREPPKRRESLKDQYRVNHAIREREVRLVGENIQVGVYTVAEALRIAEQQGLDLVEISPKAAPPVCKILDYQKFLYEQKKRQKEAKSKSSKIVIKEIRFGPQTDDHDYNFKLKHAISFLKEGAKVKAYVFFKGRSILFKEQGELLLLRFANDLEDLARVEQMPFLEGKRMFIMLMPKKAAEKAPAKPKPDAAPKPQKEKATEADQPQEPTQE